jgi:hypothetical protein
VEVFFLSLKLTIIGLYKMAETLLYQALQASKVNNKNKYDKHTICFSILNRTIENHY